ncbi:MAG: hypothetical protein AAF715_21625 [Myxococcota bacterium]
MAVVVAPKREIQMKRKTRWTRWAIALARWGSAGIMAIATGGCIDRPLEPVEPRGTLTFNAELTQSSVDRIDLLLVIDNSRSMADKQQILSLAVPDLADRLVNPTCVDPESGEAAPMQPSGPLEVCPAGSQREFQPIVDVHIGVITSSLGGHGSNACGGVQENDGARLIARDGRGGRVETYDDNNFLAWDPDPQAPAKSPPGETDQGALAQNLSALVQGAGEEGCGYESTLEAWYRFLAEPDPHDRIELRDGKAERTGRDDTLLAQRRAFLRPDSLLAIVMLSDENDCSIRQEGQFHLAAGLPTGSLPRPRPECAVDPNDPCCRSCGAPQDGCPDASDVCDADGDGEADALSDLEDHINVRCFDQKRRFGIDFLYPMSRYENALRAPSLPDRNGNLVPNPIFADLTRGRDGVAVRSSDLVFIAGIVGVPWQEIARKSPDGSPDLLSGLTADGRPQGGYQSAGELSANGTWDRILGDPKCYGSDPDCRPDNPLMIESIAPRTGPGLVDASTPLGNPINGHEYTIARGNDLQYACIFDLVDGSGMPAPVDCSEQPNGAGCDCDDDTSGDNPLCYWTGEGAPPLDATMTYSGPSFTQTQFRAKAYPGLRHLQLLQSVGDQGIVGSICPEQLVDPTLENFGYRPAVGAIIERLKVQLNGQCLQRSLTPDVDGTVRCRIVEARRLEDDAASCAETCTAPGRRFIDPLDPAVVAVSGDATRDDNCFCEIEQLTGDDGAGCKSDVSSAPVNPTTGEAVHGWCYVDAATVPKTGDPRLVSDCPATQQRLIRFVNEGRGESGAKLFIACSGE